MSRSEQDVSQELSLDNFFKEIVDISGNARDIAQAISSRFNIVNPELSIDEVDDFLSNYFDKSGNFQTRTLLRMSENPERLRPDDLNSKLGGNPGYILYENQLYLFKDNKVEKVAYNIANSDKVGEFFDTQLDKPKETTSNELSKFQTLINRKHFQTDNRIYMQACNNTNLNRWRGQFKTLNEKERFLMDALERTLAHKHDGKVNSTLINDSSLTQKIQGNPGLLRGISKKITENTSIDRKIKGIIEPVKNTIEQFKNKSEVSFRYRRVITRLHSVIDRTLVHQQTA